MNNTWRLGLFLFSFFLLIGCQDKEPLPKSTDKVPVTVPTTEEKDKTSELIEDEEDTNGMILIKDPTTSKTIMTIDPNEFGYDSVMEVYLSNLQKIAKELARGNETTTGYDQIMVLDKITDTGQIVKGKPQVILKESELVERLLIASEKGGTVFLPIYTTESNYNEQDVLMLNEVVLASYTTYFKPTDTGRNRNIELSTNAIHNVIVGNGDYFSFNTIVGERTKERGYQTAPEIINKKRVLGIGGGICQTSSTLFNVVDQVGVRIVERHHHSLSVGYVPAGRDATVSYGTLDFRFQNISGAPFIIKTIYSGNQITIEIRTAEKYKIYFL